MDDCICIAFTGRKFRVEWATTLSGEMPAKEFFDQLPQGDRAKVEALLRRFAEIGFITNQEHFKKIEDGLFEFKRFQIRLLGDHRPGGRFVLSLGLKKKKDRHKRKDIEKAKQILAENDKRDKAQRT